MTTTMTVQAALECAITHHRGGRLDEAEAIYRRVLEADPDQPDALHLLGLAEKARGRTDQALALIGAAIARLPDFAEAHYNLGNLLRDLGRPDEAWAAFDRAREAKALRALRSRLASHRATRLEGGPGKLILGLAFGYDRVALEPFVRSLAAAGYDGDAVLFMAEPSGDTLDFLSRHRIAVELVEAHHHIPFHIALTRYLLYSEYLAKALADPRRRQRWGRVMLTDTRDVVFQDDPFPERLSHELLFVLESREFPIGRCPNNASWVQEGFGAAMLAALAEKPISCSGTTFGTLHGTVEYLLQMQIMALGLPRVARYRTGIDQGIHNVMLHTGLLSNAGVIENGTEVVTLGRGRQDLWIGPDGTFHAAHGHRIRVVHQYDYHAAYETAVRRRLAAVPAG